MLSSTIIFLAVLASAGPAFSVPITTFPQEARDTGAELVEREPLVLPLNFHNAGTPFLRPLSKIPVKPLVNPVGFLPIQQREELAELLARADADVDESGASLFSTAFKVLGKLFHQRDLDARDADELLELFSREDVDESGASLLGTAFKVFSKFFRRRDLDARDADELLELFARADVDESGASLLGTAFKVFSKLFRKNDLDARDADELLELFSREDVDESGASLLGTAFKVFSKFFRKRDLDAREADELLELLARADADESAAASFFTNILKKILPQVHRLPLPIPISREDASDDESGSLIANLKPFLSEPINRFPPSIIFKPHTPIFQDHGLETVQARDDDSDSGALNLPTFVRIPFINHVPVSVNHFPVLKNFPVGLQTRELLEILARADIDDDGSGAFSFSKLKDIGKIALNLGSFVGNLIPSHAAPPPPPPAQTGAAPVQQRDLLELLARADDDESGASIITAIKGIFNDAEKLKKVASVTGIASDAASIFGSLTHPAPASQQQQAQPPQQRDLFEILARAVDDLDEESGASIFSTIKGLFNDAEKLKKVASVTSIASDAASVVGSLIHPASAPQQQQAQPVQQRELFEILARAVDDLDEESGASIFSVFKNIFKVAGGLIGSGSSNSDQQKTREFVERSLNDLD